jgi:molecular chaperone GrpE
MAKKHDDKQSKTEVHVETHTESHVEAGADDRVAELTSDLQRVQAEFVNYRRRAEAEKADILDFAKTRVVREFLSVRDSFDAELAHRPAEADANWAKSIDAIRTQFDKVLATLGVERFESQGQPFDHHLHEALAMEDGEGEQEIVIEELQPGYKLGDTILRHAMVKVGRPSKS